MGDGFVVTLCDNVSTNMQFCPNDEITFLCAQSLSVKQYSEAGWLVQTSISGAPCRINDAVPAV